MAQCKNLGNVILCNKVNMFDCYQECSNLTLSINIFFIDQQMVTLTTFLILPTKWAIIKGTFHCSIPPPTITFVIHSCRQKMKNCCRK